MPATADLIDAGIKYYDNIDPSDADNATRRTRVLHYLQLVVDEVWYEREWPFSTVRVDTLTIAAGATSLDLTALSTEIPGNLTKDCSLFWKDVQKEVKERSIQELEQIRRFQLDPDPPTYFAITGIDQTNFLPRIEFVAPTSTVNVVFTYKKNPPILLDASDATSMLNRIPRQWHWNVIFAGLIARLQEGKGDARDWERKYRKGLALMIESEIGRQTTTNQLPAEVYGMW